MESKAMSRSPKSATDGFSLSLGGLTTVASFAIAPAVDANRLNQVRDGGRKLTRRRPKPLARLFVLRRRPESRPNRARAAKIIRGKRLILADKRKSRFSFVDALIIHG